MKKTIYATGVSVLMMRSPISAEPTRVAQDAEKSTTGAVTQTPGESSSAPESLLAALKARDLGRVEKLLADDPSLANTRRLDGISALILALSLQDGEAFVRPQSNPFLRAILARRPTLDGFEAAAVGDIGRLTTEIERNPTFVHAMHALPISWTALQFAAFGGQLGAARLLLKHGADVHAIAQTKFRNTPLQIALLTGQVEVAQLLIAHGADVNAKQAEGFAAMHEAAQLGDSSLIHLLHKAGADVNVAADNGTTPLDVALRQNRKEAVDTLRQLGAKPGKS